MPGHFVFLFKDCSEQPLDIQIQLSGVSHFLYNHTHVQASTEHQMETTSTRQIFHRFGELPFELRSMVWHMAMRPVGLRGVQRFSILPGWGRGSASLDHLRLGVWHQDQGIRRLELQVSASIANNSSSSAAHPVYSWSLGNPSACPWDAGLWTACAESRRFMMKHREAVLKRAEAEELQQIAGGGSGWSDNIEDVRTQVVEKFKFLRSAMTITLDSGEQVPLTIDRCDPHVLNIQRNLLSLNTLRDLSSIFLSSQYGDKSTFQFGPLFKQINNPQHVALEFDPSRNVNLQSDFPPGSRAVFKMMVEPSPRGFIARVTYFCAAQACAIRMGESIYSRFSCKL